MPGKNGGNFQFLYSSHTNLNFQVHAEGGLGGRGGLGGIGGRMGKLFPERCLQNCVDGINWYGGPSCKPRSCKHDYRPKTYDGTNGKRGPNGVNGQREHTLHL